MKHYITRPGHPDFVCQAATVADAIILFWLVERETPRASYRVHQGRLSEARTVSAAVTFWRIRTDLREPLFDALQEVSSKKQFTEFCTNAITIGKLLGH
jgi:hypothetical protein